VIVRYEVEVMIKDDGQEHILAGTLHKLLQNALKPYVEGSKITNLTAIEEMEEEG